MISCLHTSCFALLSWLNSLQIVSTVFRTKENQISNYSALTNHHIMPHLADVCNGLCCTTQLW